MLFIKMGSTSVHLNHERGDERGKPNMLMLDLPGCERDEMLPVNVVPANILAPVSPAHDVVQKTSLRSFFVRSGHVGIRQGLDR